MRPNAGGHELIVLSPGQVHHGDRHESTPPSAAFGVVVPSRRGRSPRGLRGWCDPEYSAAVEGREPFVVVLGVAQDGGRPQAGCRAPCCRDDSRPGYSPASLAIVDPRDRRRWLIDATPDITRQLARLDEVTDLSLSGDDGSPILDGVLLTHAHMGHYTGLIHLGREAAATHALAVHATERMTAFLASNSPWRELIDHGHIALNPIDDVIHVMPSLRVRPIPVPHRDELSDTVAYVIEGPSRRVLWLPDIDNWDAWDQDLVTMIEGVDRAYLDGTFFDDDELDRDMSVIPHPRIRDTIERVGHRAPHLADRVRFIHLNHTNPALDSHTPQRKIIDSAGMAVAEEGERFAL